MFIHIPGNKNRYIPLEPHLRIKTWKKTFTNEFRGPAIRAGLHHNSVALVTISAREHYDNLLFIFFMTPLR